MGTGVLARNVAILFSDIEGSTRLLQDLGPTYDLVLMEHRNIMRNAFARFGGDERGTEGDSFFVLFPSASAAASAARDAQRGLAAHGWSNDAQVRVRMGIHVGEVREVADDVVGLAIHEGARIGAAAHGGQVLVSEGVVRSAGTSVEGVAWRGLGRHRLKDVGEIELFQLDDPELPGEFPPPRAQGSTRNNLPAQASSFIGRESELADVTERLAATRLLTLTGAGGAGKSRLALRLAADQGGRFSDGVWFVDLAPVTEPERAAVEQQVAAAMGLSEASGDVCAALATRTALIVVDNCEHILDAVTEVVDDALRRAPDVVFVCTSREPLGVRGEVVYRVPSLAADDAYALFLARAQAISHTFQIDDANRSAVVDVVRRLDAIPLALELAAARLGSLSIEQIAERLDQRFRLLSGRATGAMARQRTLQATVDWSYDLLESSARTVLRRTGVFVGGFDLDAAEAVCATPDIDALDVLDLMDQLVTKSLVMAETRNGRVQYRLLETIRQYAIDRMLEGDELDAVRDAHLDWVTGLAADSVGPLYDGTGVGEEAWLARVDVVAPNIRAAFEWALNVGRVGDAVTIIFGLMPWYLARGRTIEGFELSDAVLAHDPPPGDAALVAFVSMICHSNSTGVTEELLQRCELSADGMRDSAYPWAASGLEALNSAAAIGTRDKAAEGHVDKNAVVLAAVERCTKAVAEAKRDGHAYIVGLTMNQLHWAHWYNDDVDSALTVVSEALGEMERARLSAGTCRMHIALARIYASQNEWERVETHSSDALIIARRRGDIPIILGALEHLAVAAERRGDLETARALRLSILDFIDDLGEPNQMARTRNEVAWFSLLTGDALTARALAEESLSIAPAEFPDRDNVVHTLAAAQRALGHLQEAWPLLVGVADRCSGGAGAIALRAALEDMGALRFTIGDTQGGIALLRAAQASHEAARATSQPDERSRRIIDRGRADAGDAWEKTPALDLAAAREAALAMPAPEPSQTGQR